MKSPICRNNVNLTPWHVAIVVSVIASYLPVTQFGESGSNVHRKTLSEKNDILIHFVLFYANLVKSKLLNTLFTAVSGRI